MRLLAADDEAVVVDDVGVDGDVVEGVDGRDELGRSSGSDGRLEFENSDGRKNGRRPVPAHGLDTGKNDLDVDDGRERRFRTLTTFRTCRFGR